MYVFILVWSVLYPHVGWLDPPFLTAPTIFDRPGKSGRLSNACLYYNLYIYIHIYIYTHTYIYTHPAHIQPQKITKNLGQSTWICTPGIVSGL